MQVQGEDKPYDDINITPMLDLAYVLLVIFILMTTATVQGLKVNLPESEQHAEPRQAANQSDHDQQRRENFPRHGSGHNSGAWSNG